MLIVGLGIGFTSSLVLSVVGAAFAFLSRKAVEASESKVYALSQKIAENSRQIQSAWEKVDKSQEDLRNAKDSVNALREQQLKDQLEAHQKFVTHEEWLVAMGKFDIRLEKIAETVNGTHLVLEALKGRIG
jgi:predicted  nucleic acid-binding Zn-ribbon protein